MLFNRFALNNATFRCFMYSLHMLKRPSSICYQAVSSIHSYEKTIRVGLTLPKTRRFSFSTSRLSTVVPFKLADIGEGIREVEVKEW